MKNENTTFRKKLKAYSALAGSLVAAGTANAQIVYTDVAPDQTFSNNNDVYNLDLNNDATVDFQIKLTKGTTSTSGSVINVYKVDATPQGGVNAVAVSANDPLAMSSGNAIDGTLTWANPVSRPMASSSGGTSGNWPGATDKYLPLKIVVSSQTYYGWARFDVAADAAWFKIKDYAYNTVANQQILAGQKTTTGIREAEKNAHALVHAFDKTIYVSVSGEDAKAGVVSVKNTMGQGVLTQPLNGENTRIPMTSFNSGIYFVSVNAGGNITTKKVFIR